MKHSSNRRLVYINDYKGHFGKNDFYLISDSYCCPEQMQPKIGEKYAVFLTENTIKKFIDTMIVTFMWMPQLNIGLQTVYTHCVHCTEMERKKDCPTCPVKTLC